jgi:hypothetical protein
MKGLIPMTRVESVYITPPTNTPISQIDPTGATSRRRFLSQAAGVTAGGAVLALATVSATADAAAPRAALAPSGIDPIYTAIERHERVASVWDAAVDVRNKINDLHLTAEQRDDLDEPVEGAREALDDAAIDLINTAPTTLAGIARAINFVREQMAQEDGAYMPSYLALKGSDYPEIIGWIDAFLDTIEYAARELDWAGKAVAS